MFVIFVIMELLHSQVPIINAFPATTDVISAMVIILINATRAGEIIGKVLIQILVLIRTFQIIFICVETGNIRFLVLYQMVFVIALFVIFFA